MNSQPPNSNSVPPPEFTCLSLQELDRYVNAQGSSEWRQHAAAHIEACASCLAEVDLLREFESAEAESHEGKDLDWVVARLEQRWPPKDSPVSVVSDAGSELASEANAVAWWKRLFTGGPIAPAFLLAAVVLFVAAGISVMMRSSPELVVDPDGASHVLRSGSLNLISPAGQIAEVPAELRWEPLASAARYRVALLAVDGSELWSAETADDTIALPDAQRALILPGRTMIWSLRAFDARGKAISPPGEQEFRLRRP